MQNISPHKLGHQVSFLEGHNGLGDVCSRLLTERPYIASRWLSLHAAVPGTQGISRSAALCLNVMMDCISMARAPELNKNGNQFVHIYMHIYLYINGIYNCGSFVLHGSGWADTKCYPEWFRNSPSCPVHSRMGLRQWT